jgi:hypothetical protein
MTDNYVGLSILKDAIRMFLAQNSVDILGIEMTKDLFKLRWKDEAVSTVGSAQLYLNITAFFNRNPLVKTIHAHFLAGRLNTVIDLH